MGKICEKCGDYVLGLKCTCKRFLIEHDGEKYEQYGKSIDDALDKFARDYNTVNENCLIGDEIEVHIDGKKYNITAELTIDYYVSEA